MTMSPGDSTKSFSKLVATEIKVAMARRDIRQSQLARALGENDTWLSVRLRGIQAIDLNDLARIADALGVAPIDLLPSRDVANTLRNLAPTESTTPTLAESASSEPASSTRPPRNAKRHRTRPAGLTPKSASRRPAMIPRPAAA